ncbi:MAG: tyrosine--tRNA ligase, partial [Hyphomicrobiales bacterium]
HGRDAAAAAAETARRTFEGGEAAEGLPTSEIARAELERGLGLLGAFVASGLASSNGDARRHVQGGAARVNDRPVQDIKAVLSAADVNADGVIKLSIGKKRHALLKPV